MKFPIQYKNGNVKITLHSDGTKIRTFTGEPMPEFPESNDLKITNKCDINCPYCHESSLPGARGGNIYRIIQELETLPPVGIELAIGGGNPGSHPDLIFLLETLKKRNFICNITLHREHAWRIEDFILQDLVHGIGISGAKVPEFLWNNVIYHFIAGINNIEDIEPFKKILVLGFKNLGRGKKCNQEKIKKNLDRWYKYIPMYFKEKIISFDNLAIEQLGIKRFFTDEGWKYFYMGDDGQFSMYIDGVRGEFAISSTSKKRVSWNETSIINFFQKEFLWTKNLKNF